MDVIGRGNTPEGKEIEDGIEVTSDEGMGDCGSASPSDEDCSEQMRDPLGFRCDVPGCDAAFRKSCRLQWHIRVHDGERPYKCDFPDCDKQYTRSYHLTRHKKKAHEQEELSVELSPGYSCSLDGCRKVLSSKQLLDRHLDNYHKKRQFVCATCGKRFQKHQHLRSHEFEHNRVFPFLCPKEGCGKGFLTRAKLTRHSRSHEGYACDADSCNEKFIKWSALRKHKSVTHRKIYQCQQCSKTFARRSLLEDHVKTHDKEREAFECSSCKSVLLSEKSLKVHQARCAALKQQLICSFPACGKIFLRAANFEKHRSLHSLVMPNGDFR